jgi:hypothetical protein
MEYTKPELIELRDLLNTRIAELIQAGQYVDAARLTAIRDKVQTDIDTRHR